MGIQFTGLASGLDTQSIIKELMKVEQIKVDRVQKEQTKLEWKKTFGKKLIQKFMTLQRPYTKYDFQELLQIRFRYLYKFGRYTSYRKLS